MKINTRHAIVKSSLITLLALSTLSNATVYGNDGNNPQESIVGVWNCSLAIGNGNDIDYLVETFNENGTLLVSTTGENSESFSFNPTGIYGSAAHGIWRKIAKNRYELRASEVFNTKSNTIPGVPAFIAGTPSLRSLNIAIEKVENNGNTKSAISGHVDFYGVDDLTFQGPVLFTLPFGDNTCKRLKF